MYQQGNNRRKRDEIRNTTPLLLVKTLTSQGAFVIMGVVGGATARARIESGK